MKLYNGIGSGIFYHAHLFTNDAISYNPTGNCGGANSSANSNYPYSYT